MTSITDILAMEPRYNNATKGDWHVKKMGPIGYAEYCVAWSPDGELVADIVYSEPDANLMADAKLNAAKAILGKKLAEALAGLITDLENRSEWHNGCVCAMRDGDEPELACGVGVLHRAEAALAEWDKLKEGK